MLTELENEFLHHLSSGHRALLEKVESCGCFHCLGRAPTSAIQEWIDNGQTALCPSCHIDSVLPEARFSLEGGLILSTLSLSVLRDMQEHWFPDPS